MAQALANIARVKKTEDEIQADKVRRLQEAMLDNEDSLIKVMHLMQLLDKARMLDMANALLEQGTDILEIVVHQAGKPQYAGGIKSLIGLVQMLGTLDTSALTKALRAVSEVSKRAEEGQVPQMNGAFQLLGAIHDPDVAAGIGFAVELLKILGKQFTAQPQSQASPGANAASTAGTV